MRGGEESLSGLSEKRRERERITSQALTFLPSSLSHTVSLSKGKNAAKHSINASRAISHNPCAHVRIYFSCVIEG